MLEQEVTDEVYYDGDNYLIISSNLILLDDVPPSGKKYDTMIYEPVDIKDRLYMPNEEAELIQEKIPAITGGEFYWHEINLR
ncbi:MAG: hypothetical protein K9K82_10825 [Desulfobacteraceae bacterium]|nr:hypothetical protein [Desulfobacteraceae bacterium]